MSPPNKLISQNAEYCRIWAPRWCTWTALLIYIVADFKSNGGVASPVFTTLYIQKVPNSLLRIHTLMYLQFNLYMSNPTIFVATPEPKTTLPNFSPKLNESPSRCCEQLLICSVLFCFVAYTKNTVNLFSRNPHWRYQITLSVRPMERRASNNIWYLSGRPPFLQSLLSLFF